MSRRPATTPASIRIQGAWQIAATGLARSKNARVMATVQGVSRTADIAFERAPPDVITVSANSLSVAAGPDAQVTITATLHREVGDVTDGTVVTFRAVDAAGDPVGTFGNVTLSEGGTATADFRPGGAAPGFVTVIVGAEGTSVTGSLRIELT